MSKTNKIVYFLITTLFFIIFDIFFSNILIKDMSEIPSNSVFELVYVQNCGAAFNLLENAKLFLILFASVAILGISYYMIKNISKYTTFSIFWVSLLLAGIFCNMYERIVLGYVRDFFKLNFIDFPVFNISDIFINISVLAIVVIIIKHNFSKNNETDN